MQDYIIFIGAFDHKLGPVCVSPPQSCEWVDENIENPRVLLQDGLNTRSKLFNFKSLNHIIQVMKFSVHDERIRGGVLRCCLFSIVPENKPILPEDLQEQIIDDFLQSVDRNDKDVRCEEGQRVMVSWAKQLNEQLGGTIGEGQVEHKRRDLLTTIIGYSEVLLDGILGELTEEQQESVTYILAYARELLMLGKKQDTLLG